MGQLSRIIGVGTRLTVRGKRGQLSRIIGVGTRLSQEKQTIFWYYRCGNKTVTGKGDNCLVL